MSSVVRNRSLLIMGVAESVSNVGNWVTMIAIFSLIVFRGGGGVVESSGVMLAGLGPALVLSPLAGWLTDRYDRKTLMIASELLCGLAVTGLVFASRLELIYALLALETAFSTLMAPARQAAVPDVVARADLTRANAFLQQLSGTIKIGGPMLAGLILSLVEPHQAIILDAVSFAVSAAVLSRLPALPPHGSVRAKEEGLAATATVPPARTLAGVLRDSLLLRLLFVMEFLGVVIIMGFDVLSSIFTRDVLHGNEEFYGLLIGLIGLGTVGAAVGLTLRKGERDPWRDLIAGLLLLGCIPAALALASQMSDPALARGMAIAGAAAGGVGNGLVHVQVSTLLQLLSPPALLGRVGGAFQSTMVAGQLVSVFATPLLVPGLFPLGAYFAFATLAIAVLALFAVIVLRNTMRGSRQWDAA